MLSQTQSETWRERVEGILNQTVSTFFKDGVMFEAACEASGNCDTDQQSFKAYLSRSMAATTQVAPFTADTIMPLLQTSAQAAAKQCSGTAGPYGTLGNVCGLQWTKQSAYDGSFGVGQQLAAMEVIQSNLIQNTHGPVTNKTGGTSQGNPSAGGTAINMPQVAPITMADKAGAGLLTALVLSGFIGLMFWMIQGA